MQPSYPTYTNNRWLTLFVLVIEYKSTLIFYNSFEESLIRATCNKYEYAVVKGVIFAVFLIKSVELCNRWLSAKCNKRHMLERDDI